MTQYAIVKRLMGAAKAEVEVLRGTSCGDDCASCGVCKYASKIRVEADNAMNADVGDRVEIETRTSRIMGAAFLVYVLPFILFFIGYGIGAAADMSQGRCIIMSFAFFAVGLAAAVVIGRLRSKKPITYEITRILEHGASL